MFYCSKPNLSIHLLSIIFGHILVAMEHIPCVSWMQLRVDEDVIIVTVNSAVNVCVCFWIGAASGSTCEL